MGSVLVDMMARLSDPSPEGAVERLSMEEVQQQRTELALGKAQPLDKMDEKELLELQTKWLGPKAAAQLIAGQQEGKAYVFRKRIALELRFRRQQHDFAKTVSAHKAARTPAFSVS